MHRPVEPKIRQDAQPCEVTWEQAAGRPEVAVRLDHLPPGVEFGQGFPEPIRFDPQRKLLLYRGFMTSVSYRFLRGLSDDLAYLAALDELNVKSSFVMQSSKPPRRRWFWPFVIFATGSLLLFVAQMYRARQG